MPQQLATKITQLRQAAGLTMEQLAESTHLRPGQIKLIEHGRVTPSMATVVALARALNVRPGTLLDGQEQSGLRVHSPEFHPSIPGMSSHDEDARKHIKISSLAPQKNDRNMDPMLLQIGYVPATQQVMSDHEGEEFIYVLEGEIELRYGSEVYPLRAGESIYYDSLVPHVLSSAAADAPAAKAIIVMYTPY